MCMKVTYQLKFESEAQREQLESVLLNMGIPFREVKAMLAEGPGTEYQAVDPRLLEMTEKDKRAIDLAIQQFENGEYVELADVRARLKKRIERYKDAL